VVDDSATPAEEAFGHVQEPRGAPSIRFPGPPTPAPPAQPKDEWDETFEFYMERLSRGPQHLDEAQLWLKAVELTHDSLERAKAARRQAPVPPPAPPMGHYNRPPTRFDVDQLATHLPAKQRKELLGIITPLAPTELPEPADLGPFWLTVEEGVLSLTPTLTALHYLNSNHLRQLTPVILGARGWQHFQGRTWGSWDQFKREVNADFGLSEAQLSARFYAMRPAANEDSYAFIIRVEANRRTVGANEEATLHCFLPKLCTATQEHLERVRSTKAMLGLAATSGTELTWKEVVAMARDARVHGKVASPAPAPPTPPSGGYTPAAPAAPSLPAAPRLPGVGAAQVRRCKYCTPLGAGMDNHDHKWCFVDPASSSYKPDVRARRIQAAKKKGTKLPDYLQEEDPKGTVGSLQPSLAEDLVGALRLIPGIEEDEVQAHLEAIMGVQEGEED
jgi:hypothetical protein